MWLTFNYFPGVDFWQWNCSVSIKAKSNALDTQIPLLATTGWKGDSGPQSLGKSFNIQLLCVVQPGTLWANVLYSKLPSVVTRLYWRSHWAGFEPGPVFPKPAPHWSHLYYSPQPCSEDSFLSGGLLWAVTRGQWTERVERPEVRQLFWEPLLFPSTRNPPTRVGGMHWGQIEEDGGTRGKERETHTGFLRRLIFFSIQATFPVPVHPAARWTL